MARQTFGTRLSAARKMSGLTARGLDALVGLSGGYTSRLERGRPAFAGGEALSGFARVLGVSVDWLLDGKGEMPDAAAVRAAAEKSSRRSSRKIAASAA
jgi:transcriptional regulator with XRE-family HTH domain